MDGGAASREVKVVLLGDSGVGKSSIVMRFVSNTYDKYNESTIGASFMSKMIMVDGHSIKYQIWDTAGQEKYHSLAPMYYRGAAAAIVVYDITKRSTFETLKAWVKELQQLGPPDIIICVCGNKADLKDQREVDSADAKRYAQEIGAIFFETSAKSGDASGKVQDMFVDVARKLPAALEPAISDTTNLREPRAGKGAASSGGKADKPSGGGCC